MSSIALPFPVPFRIPYLTDLFQALIQAPGLADPYPGAAAAVEVARVPRSSTAARIGRRRAWRAIPMTEANTPMLKSMAKVVAAQADAGFARLAYLAQFGEVGESTMASELAIPLLQSMGWLCNQNHVFPDRTRPDGYAPPVAFEFKRPDPLYDLIDAKNAHSGYKTIADQILHYLRQDGIACVIYTNGRFWWRIEEDEQTGELFAMRFNMILTVNDWRNRVTHARLVNRFDALHSPLMERFVQAFCAQAFSPDNDETVSAHVGMNLLYPGIGPVWLKDLNQGFG